MRAASGAAGSRLLSVGAARPSVVHTAAELIAPFSKGAEWVTARTGIGSVRRLAPSESVEDLAVVAGEQAMNRAGSPHVDLVITASCSSIPQHGQGVAARLAPSAGWFEINAACSGFCYALAAADSFIRTGSAKVVLVVAVEQMSRLLDAEDLGTSIIFGDGAGAAVVTATEAPNIGPVAFGSEGASSSVIHCSDGLLRMEGRRVFRWAVETVPNLVLEACRRAKVALADVEVFVPHQANLRITEAILRKLGVQPAIVAADVREAGNTSAASIPLAIDAVLADRPDAGGKLAVLAGFGAGLSYAAQVIRLPFAAASAGAT